MKRSILASILIMAVVSLLPGSAAAHVGEHTVVKGDSLSKIASEHQTNWQRLWFKNLGIANPDLIFPGNLVIVPPAEEVVAPRTLTPAPALVQPTVPVKPVTSKPQNTSKPAAPAVQRRAPIAGNTYTRGQCTWYAKSRRPDLPNNLGNANTWVARAQAQGIPTGRTPRAGAIGQKGNHVVYVERVLGDGNVVISEMNYDFRGSLRTVTRPASWYYYIY